MNTNDSGSSSTSGVRVVTRRYLFEQMQLQNLPTINEKLDYLENHLLSFYCDTEDNKKKLKHKFSHFKSNVKQKWASAYKIKDVFLKQNESWLDGTFEIPIGQNRQGRPRKSFGELSERSKRRKTEELRSTVNDEIILHAAQIKLQTSGKRDASKVLKDIITTPTRATKYRRAFYKEREKIAPLTPLQALSMFVEADLSKRQYEIIRATNKKFYPCYDLLVKAKKQCYPPKESFQVTATSAETKLQCLIDNSIIRLSNYLEEVLHTLNDNEKKSLKIICKWGCDGSQQAQFKQTFASNDESDANIFLSSFVPIQIVCGDGNKKIVWQNPTPSSPRYCRPIRFRFLKESEDVTKAEISYVQDAINSLTPTEVKLNGHTYSFKHIFKMTMVDGKVCNAATGTKSTSRCYICGATSKDFNNLDKKNDIDPHALEFGLSVLHARIRLFESILHLAYKLPVKKYREKRTEEDKVLEKQKKLQIQERFRSETGLLIDMPKSNFGNTNDGNTSRRFFENPELAAEITEISLDLICRLKVILETISSGHKINIKKFDEYALETAKLYVELYGWHPMTPTMHKILIHGGKIIENALLPIGQLSEEAAEARNKHFRSYRQNFARKFSREECNRDIYQRLLLSSDPLLSSLRKVKKTKNKAFLPDTINLLLPGEPNEKADHSLLESEEDDMIYFHDI